MHRKVDLSLGAFYQSMVRYALSGFKDLTFAMPFSHGFIILYWAE